MKIVCFTLEAEGTVRSSSTSVTEEPPRWGGGCVRTHSWSQTLLTQLELLTSPVWVLSDLASVNGPGMDHGGIGEPVGGGSPHDEPTERRARARGRELSGANPGLRGGAAGSRPAAPSPARRPRAHGPPYLAAPGPVPGRTPGAATPRDKFVSRSALQGASHRRAPRGRLPREQSLNRRQPRGTLPGSEMPGAPESLSSPSPGPVAVQHHRVAEKGVAGALVKQRALGVHVVGAPARDPQAQQQHHRLPDGGPSGARPASCVLSHALSEGNIQPQMAQSRRRTG